MELADKAILVTGANGFIGSHIAERLAENEGARVRCLVRKMPAGSDRQQLHSRNDCFLGDVTDRETVARAAAGCDIVIHAAACQPRAPLAPRARFVAVNVGGTENLMQAFEPPSEGRFLLLSTINVHGIPPPTGASAESLLRYSGDRYSDSKVDGERTAWKLALDRGIPLTVVRPGCTFGPNGTAWTIQPVERIRRRSPVLVGGGRGICNPMYIGNLVDLIVAALKSNSAVGQSFIGCQSPGVEWREFFGSYGKMIGMSPRSVPYQAAMLMGRLSSLYEQFSGRSGLVSPSSVAFYSHRVHFDVAKNARFLGYKPRITFEQGMKLTEAWLRERRLI